MALKSRGNQPELERTPGVAAVSQGRQEGSLYANCRLPSPAEQTHSGDASLYFNLREYSLTDAMMRGWESVDDPCDDPTTEYNPSPLDDSDLVTEPVNQECGGWALLGRCENRDFYVAKQIVCGKEWCPDCGKNDSPAHHRRLSRWLSSENKQTGVITYKAQSMQSVGYFVIELPLDCRDALKGVQYKEKQVKVKANGKYTGEVKTIMSRELPGLKDFQRRAIKPLKGKHTRVGLAGGFFKRGLYRWHWFNSLEGDDVPMLSPGFNPHLNILVDSGYIQPDDLETIKKAIRKSVGIDNLIINYSYHEGPAEIYQKVKYVTRATFRLESWDTEFADDLFDFRNGSWWGTWDKEPTWTLKEAEADVNEDVVKLNNNKCPICGGDIKWCSHVIDITWVQTIWQSKLIGDGYYKVPVRDWTGERLSPERVFELDRLSARSKDIFHKRCFDFQMPGWWEKLLELPDSWDNSDNVN
jgi:hypothetical protein